MRKAVDQLLSIVYRFYPRGLQEYDPGYQDSEAHRRLVEARIRAGAEDSPWRTLLDRLHARHPDALIQNGSLHLPRGGWDAGYAGWWKLPERGPHEEHHKIGFLISFLAEGAESRSE